jgi:hypothetical protein
MKAEREPEMDADDVADLKTVMLGPISNAVRFTVMRAVRFILSVVFEVASLFAWGPAVIFTCLTGLMLFSLFVLVFCGFFEFLNHGMVKEWQYPYAGFGNLNYSHWFYRFLFMHPYIPAAAGICIAMVLWALSLSLGIPHRYQNTPPGMSAVACGNCHRGTANRTHCIECGHSRVFDFAVLKLVWMVNAAITSAWIMHDAIAGFVGFSGSFRGK